MSRLPLSLSLLRRLWCVEAIRLKEEQWGPFADEAELRRARSQSTETSTRIEIRAQLLCERLGWLGQQQTILRYGRWALYVWALLALLLGLGMAQAALGFGSERVNIIRAFLLLLGVPTAGLLLWAGGMLHHLLRRRQTLALKRPWRWLTARIARGPEGPLLMQALINVLQRQRLGFWLVSWVHHLFWVIALTAAAVRLWLLLAFKRYFFQWETTLLDSERFVHLAQWASTGLNFLGFAVPDEQAIRLSDGLTVLPPSAHALWASWLIACVLVYGLLPRLLLLLLSLGCYRYYQRHAQLDMQRPGLMALLPRLGETVQELGIDRPSSPDGVPLRKEAAHSVVCHKLRTFVVGMEVAPDFRPEQAPWPEHWQWLGVVDSRAQRQALIDRLQQDPPEHVVMWCDGEQTPDRGLMAWLVEVGSYADNETVVVELGCAEPTRASMQLAWQQRLEAAGLKTVYFSFDSFLHSLLAIRAHDGQDDRN